MHAEALVESAAPVTAKAPTGIPGLDELTFGGLPAGRPALVCGGPGCGKTLLAATFLVTGAVDYGELPAAGAIRGRRRRNAPACS